MPTIADSLRRERLAHEALMTAEERIKLALELGARDLEAFRSSFDPPLSRREARLELQRRRQAGRTPCTCIDELLS